MSKQLGKHTCTDDFTKEVCPHGWTRARVCPHGVSNCFDCYRSAYIFIWVADV
jgi:hypothetical protein